MTHPASTPTWTHSWSDTERALTIVVAPIGRRGAFGPLIGGSVLTFALATASAVAFLRGTYENPSFLWLGLAILLGWAFVLTTRDALRIGFGVSELRFTDSACTVSDRALFWTRKRTIALTPEAQLLAGPVASREQSNTREKLQKGVALYVKPNVYWLARQLEGDDAMSLRETVLRHFPGLTPRAPS